MTPTGRRAAVVTALALAALLGACSSADDEAADGTTTTTSTDGGATIPVQVDHLPEEYPATFNRFFPDEVSAHAGDTIEFTASFTGELHNVAFGTVVDDAVAAFEAVPAGASTLTGFPLPGVTPAQQEAVDRLPQPLPPDQTTSMAESNRTVQPCTLVDELPPTDGPCPEDARHVPDEPFAGTETYLASQGFIAGGETFALELADDLAPGDYDFICTIHGAWMDGTVIVAPPDEPVPAPEEVAARADRQIARAVAEHQAVADDLTDQTGPDVLAGAFGSPDPPPEVTLNVFPEEITVDAGEPVSWTVEGAHTISFDLPDGLDPASPFDRLPSGELVSDERVTDPTAGVPPMPAPPPFPRDQPPPPVVPREDLPTITLDAGRWDGSGYLNSGLLFSFFSPPVEWRLRIDEPGEYFYYCARHPAMGGTVRVE